MPQSRGSSLEEAIALLDDKSSPRRRSGAKRLRKLKDAAAGPPLLAALQREMRDQRTWETQYQMVMALAESGYKPALPCLKEMARQPFEATMVYVALGDAMVRLGRRFEADAGPILDVMRVGNGQLTEGAFRAMAMLRMKPDHEAVKAIIRYVNECERDAQNTARVSLRFWVTAAAAGWHGPEVERFVEASATGQRSDVMEAALASRQKTYREWNVL